jgi:hypothetical protein
VRELTRRAAELRLPGFHRRIAWCLCAARVCCGVIAAAPGQHGSANELGEPSNGPPRSPKAQRAHRQIPERLQNQSSGAQPPCGGLALPPAQEQMPSSVRAARAIGTGVAAAAAALPSQVHCPRELQNRSDAGHISASDGGKEIQLQSESAGLAPASGAAATMWVSSELEVSLLAGPVVGGQAVLRTSRTPAHQPGVIHTILIMLLLVSASSAPARGGC